MRVEGRGDSATLELPSAEIQARHLQLSTIMIARTCLTQAWPLEGQADCQPHARGGA